MNLETGEIPHVIQIPENTELVTRRKRIDTPNGYTDQRKFTKAYNNAWRSVFENSLFTPQESHTLLFLGAYCEPDSNAVVNDKGQLMSLKEIAKHLGWSDRNMARILKSLEMKNALAKGTTMGDERYFINPVLFGRGTWINKTTERLFETQKAKRIEEANGMLSFLRIGRIESNIITSKP